MNRHAILLLLAVCACSGDRGVTAGVVRDSAGVAIVEHGEADWAAGASWTIPDSPAVAIGAATAEEPYQLFRVTDAERGSDGRIYVLNSGSGEVRIFDADGRFLGRMGRTGSGPGEFRYPVRLWLLPGDSVMVHDASFGPRVVFAPDGTVARVESVDRAAVMALLGEGRATEDVRALADGSLVVAAWVVGSDLRPTEGQLFRPAFELLLIPRDLTHATSLGNGGGIEQMWVNVGGQRDNITALFSPHYQIAAGGSPPRIAIGNGDVYDIRLYAADGTLAQVIRRSSAPAAVAAADREGRTAEYLAFAESRGRLEQTRRLLAALPEQQFLPAHEELFVDDGGNVWVQEYRAPSHATSRWTVYDREGSIAGTFETLRDLQFMHIGDDFLLGVERDEDDVERVVLFPLTRSRDRR